MGVNNRNMYSCLQKYNKLNKSHLVGQLLNSIRISLESETKLLFCNTFPPVPLFLSHDCQYVWPKHVAENKNERTELMWCVCVAFIATAFHLLLFSDN